MKSSKKVLFSLIVVAVVILSITIYWNFSKSYQPGSTDFSALQAMEDVNYQVGLGSRVPGTPGHDKIVTWMVDQLKQAGWQVEVQQAERLGHPIQNVVAKHMPPQGADASQAPWVIFGAHYDTRMWANQDKDPSKQKDYVPGANDGASGVAVLLEMARRLPKDLNAQVWIVMVDAEDNGEIPGWDWLLGSMAFVDSLTAKPDAAIIVDMIGDKDLNIYYEANSNPTLRKQIWDQAAELGYKDKFIPTVKYNMIDDHTPFLNKGIPAVDIIDFDYPYWHTTQDTPDKVSGESMKVVGDTLLAWVERFKK